MECVQVLSSLLLLCLVSQVTQAGVLQASSDEDLVGCPDGSTCPVGNTCCLQVSGYYGCCPYRNAMCCADKQHCCPQGTYCDLSSLTCNSLGKQLPWERHHPAANPKPSLPQADQPSSASLVGQLSQEANTKADVKNVPCPDPTLSCPDGNTCCLMPNSQWVCCPIPKAVCCADGYHCCPPGSKCDSTSTHCTRGDSAETLLAMILPVKGQGGKGKL